MGRKIVPPIARPGAGLAGSDFPFFAFDPAIRKIIYTTNAI